MLIETARALFGTRSYESVTTTEIAREAGVAYGLIAHHFGNKRGLYLAVMSQIREELAYEQNTPPTGGGLEDELLGALRRHVRYIEAHETGFRALMRGDLGSDRDMQLLFDELRWSGARRILDRIGSTGEPSPLLRAAMRSWVAQFDELILDRIQTGAVSVDHVATLAAASLIAQLRTVIDIDPATDFDPGVTVILRSAR